MEVTYQDKDQETVSYISRAGIARVAYPNGDVYEGEFNDELKKHGKNCKYTFANKSSEDGENIISCYYLGEYKNGEKNGVGKMQYPNGSVYRGSWLAGARHGKGSITFSNGHIYSGDWESDKPNGRGTYVFPAENGRIEGIWKNGILQNGTFFRPDGVTYKGEFVQDVMNGQITIQFPNGASLSGELFQRNESKKESNTTTITWAPERVKSTIISI